MMRTTAGAALVLVLACYAAGAREGREENGRIRSGGLERTYLVHLPPDYLGDRPLPLVLALHGRLGDGRRQAELSRMSALADREGFIVAYPDGIDRGWSDGRGASVGEQTGLDDAAFFRDLLARLQKDYRIDPDRIYVTGMSNGGFMAMTLACELSDTVAAAAPVAATMGEVTSKSCAPTRPVAVMIVMGTDDPLIPWEGGVMKAGRRGSVILGAEATAARWAELNGCGADEKIEDLASGVRAHRFSGCRGGADVVLYEVLGGGHAWPGGKKYLPDFMIGATNEDFDASREVWEFFKQHPRTGGGDQ